MATIELASWEEIEAGGKHTGPGRDRRRMQIKLDRTDSSRRGLASQRSQDPVCQGKDHREAERQFGLSRLWCVGFRSQQGQEQDGHCNCEAGDGPCNADVKEVCTVANRRSNANE